MKTKVVSLGGSLIIPDKIDSAFLGAFRKTVLEFLDEDDERRVILVCGGGSLARRYQSVYRELSPDPQSDAADWIGIAATRLNAELCRRLFSSLCPSAVVTDPTEVSIFPGRVLIASGWKPGFSTDYDAVVLAERFSAGTVINLSDIEKVYTDDPATNPEAEPLDHLTWSEYRYLVGDEWVPGRNAPFDPIAAQLAQERRISVVVAEGKNFENVKALLSDSDFVGTVIGPD